MTADRFNFRIFDTKNKEWVNKFFIDNFNNLLICNDRKEFFILDKNRFVITQSTGLVDRNGKEIFEGDIVEIKENDGRRVSYKIIKYSKYNVAFYYTNMNSKTFYASFTEIDEGFNVEVIGNIYENEELLKKEDYYIDKNGKIIYGF